MHKHFRAFGNIEALIKQIKPTHVVECGCADGQCTIHLLSLAQTMGYALTAVSDTPDDPFPKPPANLRDQYRFVYANSWDALPNLKAEVYIIDTDHTDACLTKELTALYPNLPPGGCVILHDCESFPELRTAINRFLTSHPDVQIESHVRDSHGCTVLRRGLLPWKEAAHG